MKTVDQQLFDLVEDQEHFELTTEKGIRISVEDDHVLEAECMLLEAEDAQLTISFCCGQTAFVQLLGLTTLNDIYDLTPGSLIELYYAGLAQLDCLVAIEYTYAMSFQKLGNRIIAENDRGIKHTVPRYEKLETPDQIIAYTRQYYTLMECSEN